MRLSAASEVTEDDNGKVLGVVGGAWAAAEPEGGEIPFFDLIALGLQSVPRNEVVALSTDTTEMFAAHAKGLAKMAISVEGVGRYEFVAQALEQGLKFFYALYGTGRIQIVLTNGGVLVNVEETLPLLTSEDVGKVLGVTIETAVPRWRAVDPPSGGISSWNDLTDKPFEDGQHIYIETGEVSFDTTVTVGEMVLVHVTDTSLPKESLIGATVTAHFPDGSSQSAVIAETDIVSEYDGGIVLLIMEMVFVWVCFRSGEHTATINGETGTVEAPKAGIYVADFLMSELSAMEFACPTKCLDAKYLPADAIGAMIDEYMEEALGGDY